MAVTRTPHAEEHNYRTKINSERVSHLYLYLHNIQSTVFICDRTVVREVLKRPYVPVTPSALGQPAKQPFCVLHLFLLSLVLRSRLTRYQCSRGLL